MKSPNYKREKHPLILRLLAIWRIITRRNFIFIDFYEEKIDGEDARKVRSIHRSDYDEESEFLTLKAALLLKKKYIENDA
ncbi:hypothetical protein M0P25_04345 [archaeon]|jgi:hypothetical protein|nr:hypothetical protein [archaeon]MCK9439509.1 hypothetical protein [Patescibacteria group bacterium]